MAQVTLRDLTNNDEFTVPPEGFIFGRVGGDADIQLEDNSISRRQARVSFKGGQWLLETLAVPQGQRAPRPVSLQQGATFLVGQNEFEVVELDAEAVDEELEPDPAAKTFAPQRGKPGPAPAAPPKKATAPAAKAASAPPPKRAATASAAAPAESEEAAGGGIKGLFVGVPKGIAYYLVNVPKLLVNPMGTVRKTIDELPTEPLGKTDLIGYALPSLFISMALPSFAAGLAALIGPAHAFLLGSFLPIGPAIGAVIGAVISGFIFHPVTEWIINKLQGTSDARSRSNYFLQMMTLGIILAVPQALGILLASIPIPFINLLGPLLMLVGTIVSLYVAYQWVLKFELVKWTQLVVKVLAVLAVLGTGFGFVSGVINTIRGFGSGASVAMTAPSGDEGEAAEAAAEELGEMPTDPEEAAEWSKKKQAQILAKAAEAQKKAMAEANAAQEKAAEAQAQAESAAKKDAPPEPKRPEKKEEPKAEVKPEPEAVAVKETPPPPKEENVVIAPAGAGGGYAAFARKRDAIEKLFETDPTVLQRSADYQKLYASYVEDAFELDKKWAKENAKKPERARLNLRLKEAELYGKTSKTIDSLAAKLGVK